MLSAVEREVLAIEALPWRYAIVLNALLDKPAAVEQTPVLVNRLLRLRSGRR